MLCQESSMTTPASGAFLSVFASRLPNRARCNGEKKNKEINENKKSTGTSEVYRL